MFGIWILNCLVVFVFRKRVMSGLMMLLMMVVMIVVNVVLMMIVMVRLMMFLWSRKFLKFLSMEIFSWMGFSLRWELM